MKPPEYLRGPIGWVWLRLAARLPGSALKVGLVLWHYRALNKSMTFKTGTRDIARFLGLSPDTVRRAIDALADVGLIRLSCAPGRKCLITMVEISTVPTTNDTASQGGGQDQTVPPTAGAVC